MMDDIEDNLVIIANVLNELLFRRYGIVMMLSAVYKMKLYALK